MADQLYLSLWYPNFRFAALPAALIGVLKQFAQVATAGKASAEFGRVHAASALPLDWTESPVYQRIYVLDGRAASGEDTEASRIENAVADCTEQLHEDTAYEFEMRWGLWLPDESGVDAGLDTAWKLEPTKVRVVGVGPDFDSGSYEANGHIRVDFGLDTPFTMDEDLLEDAAAATLNARDAANRIRQNVEKLLAFTLSVEKHCGISSRLLWTESGEPLAEKLIARLQRLN